MPDRSAKFTRSGRGVVVLSLGLALAIGVAAQDGRRSDGAPPQTLKTTLSEWPT